MEPEILRTWYITCEAGDPLHPTENLPTKVFMSEKKPRFFTKMSSRRSARSVGATEKNVLNIYIRSIYICPKKTFIFFRKCEAGDAHCSTENLRIKRLMSEKKKRSFFEGNVKSKTRAFRPKKMFEKKTLLSEKKRFVFASRKNTFIFFKKACSRRSAPSGRKEIPRKTFYRRKELVFFFCRLPPAHTVDDSYQYPPLRELLARDTLYICTRSM